MAEDLKSLLNTGHFEFVIPESADESPSGVPTVPVWWKEGDQRKLLLHYQPSIPAQGGEAANDATPARRVTWSKEQIEDFTRKLGFLEKGSEDGMHFTFQQLSAVRLHAVATALCPLLSDLKSMCPTLMSCLCWCRLLSEFLRCSVS